MALDQRGPVRKMYKMGATVVNNMSSKQLTLEQFRALFIIREIMPINSKPSS